MVRRQRQYRKAPLYIAQREIEGSPWKVFFLGVFLIMLLGGAVRLSFSEAVFTQYAQFLLKTNNPHWQFRVSGAHLSLSSWGRPQLALAVGELELFDLSSHCKNEPKAVLTRLEVPIEFFKWVFTQKLKVSAVKADSVSWNEGVSCQYGAAQSLLSSLSYNPLLRSMNLEKLSQTTKLPPNLSERLFSQQELEKYQALTKSLFRTIEKIKAEDIQWPRLEVKELYVNTHIPFEVKDVSIDLRDNSWLAKGSLVTFLPDYSRRPYAIPFSLELSSKQMRFSSGRGLGEGRWSIEVQADNDRTQSGQLSLRVKSDSLPLSLTGSLLKRWNRFPLLESLRYVWSTCEIGFRIPLNGKVGMSLQQPGCRFYGKFGDISMQLVPTVNSYPDLHLKLESIRVEEWRPHCRSWVECELAEWGGSYSGSVTLHTGKGWELSGKLSQLPAYPKSEITFSEFRIYEALGREFLFHTQPGKYELSNEKSGAMTLLAPGTSHTVLNQKGILRLSKIKPLGQRISLESVDGKTPLLLIPQDLNYE